MIQSLLLAALAGGAVVFVWGAISWMALPWHHKSFQKFTDEEGVAKALMAAAPASGLYSLPAVGCGGDATTDRKSVV